MVFCDNVTLVYTIITELYAEVSWSFIQSSDYPTRFQWTSLDLFHKPKQRIIHITRTEILDQLADSPCS